MTTGPNRPRRASTRSSRRRRPENTRGWWGILLACLVVTVTAGLTAVLAVGLTAGALAAGSLALGAGAVVVLSALTLLVIALAWDRWRAQAVMVAMLAFVAKLIAFALLLALVPVPEWVLPTAAGAGALGAVVLWQVVEVLVFLRTRRQIYED